MRQGALRRHLHSRQSSGGISRRVFGLLRNFLGGCGARGEGREVRGEGARRDAILAVHPSSFLLHPFLPLGPAPDRRLAGGLVLARWCLQGLTGAVFRQGWASRPCHPIFTTCTRWEIRQNGEQSVGSTRGRVADTGLAGPLLAALQSQSRVMEWPIIGRTASWIAPCGEQP